VTLARHLSERLHLGIDVEPTGPTVPEGALLPTDSARIDGPTFEQWLRSDDATRAASMAGSA
jgi:hypothetical protein